MSRPEQSTHGADNRFLRDLAIYDELLVEELRLECILLMFRQAFMARYGVDPDDATVAIVYGDEVKHLVREAADLI